MDKGPIVSIIVAVYNVEKWLDECLKSILNQSYQSWECHIINDGSSDNSEIIALKYCELDKRFNYIKKTNGGIASVRNFGIEMSQGEFVYHVDGDDMLTHDCIKYCVNKIGESDILAADCIAISYDGKVIRQTNQGRDGDLNYSDALKMFFERKMLTSVWSKFYRRSILGNIRFSLKLKGAEDLHYNASLILSNQNIKIKISNYPIYKYRILDSSISHVLGKARLDRLLIQIEEMDNLYGKYKNIIDEVCLTEFQHNMVTDILNQYTMMGPYKQTDSRLVPFLQKWMNMPTKDNKKSLLGKFILNSPDTIRDLVVTVYYIPQNIKNLAKKIVCK